MSKTIVRKTLELELDRFRPKFPTAFENVTFSPPARQPYQELHLLTGRPENPTLGDGFHRLRAIFQIDLRYPANTGPGEAEAHGEAIKDHFHRGFTMTTDGVTTTVDATPEVGSGSNDGDRYVIPVRVRVYADVFGA